MTQVNPARHSSEGIAGLLLSLLMAAAFVGSVFGIDFVLGRSVFWQTEVRDVTQYVAGFNFYFTAPWQNPWLAFNALLIISLYGRFLLGSLFYVCLNLIIVSLVEFFGLHYGLGFACNLLTVLLLIFWIMKRWAFVEQVAN